MCWWRARRSSTTAKASSPPCSGCGRRFNAKAYSCEVESAQGAKSVCSLPRYDPVTGEGWGGGEDARILSHAPSLSLPPQATASGGGNAPSARRDHASSTNENALVEKTSHAARDDWIG